MPPLIRNSSDRVGIVVSGLGPSGETTKVVLPAFTLTDGVGNSVDGTNPLPTIDPLLPAGTDRSGTAGITSGQIIAANSARRGLEIQNVGTNNIGINEMGAAAVLSAAGTYMLAPGASIRIRTNRAVFAIAATAATAFTATEW